jgi:putative ABC transport system ATP-binding protein
MGLAERKHHRPHQLSGGQQQRVAIARALVTEPDLLLADEPTGNLDSRAGAEILALLRATCDQQGQTIVMVTHDRHAAATADRVIFLKDGQISHDLDFTQIRDKSRTQEIAAISDQLNA